MYSCLNVRFPSLGPSAAAFIGMAPRLPSGSKLGDAATRGVTKDFFKFWGRLDGFMQLAEIRDSHFPILSWITAWTKHYDYVDVFARKLPRFEAAVLDAWQKRTITRRLVNQSINFGGGVIKLSARWLPKGSLAGRLGLPVTAATALVFAREQLVFEAPAILNKEVSFTQQVAQRYHKRAQTDENKEALFKEIKGAYNARAAELLVHQLQGEQVPDKLVTHVQDHLKKERYHKISDGIHSLLGGGFLTYASLAGMGVVASGALLTLMLTPYLVSHVIDQSTSVAKFSVTKQI